MQEFCDGHDCPLCGSDQVVATPKKDSLDLLCAVCGYEWNTWSKGDEEYGETRCDEKPRLYESAYLKLWGIEY